jgi:formylglycine-generating enzyme required for sulfatase activity
MASDHLRQALALATSAGDAPTSEKIRQEIARLRAVEDRVLVDSIGVDLVRIPAGRFLMGGDEEPAAVSEFFKEERSLWLPEQPRHEVVLSKAFLLGATEVTRGQFRQFVTATGYRTDAEKDGKGIAQFNPGPAATNRQFNDWRCEGNLNMTDDHPVIGVSWNDAVAFCEWLSKKEGKKYRLPTEAEWEYACRAGTTTRYWTGNDPESLVRGANVPDASFAEANKNISYAVLKGRDGFAGLATVGEFEANPFGLYDMHGNAWEWCQDGWDKNYYQQKVKDDPLAPTNRPSHVLRGGCFM